MEQKKTNYVKTVFILGIMVIVLGISLILWNWKIIPPELPWFYSLPWGENQLVNKLFFVWLTLGQLVTWLGVYWLIEKLKQNDSETKLVILLGGLGALFLILVSIVKVMIIFV